MRRTLLRSGVFWGFRFRSDSYAGNGGRSASGRLRGAPMIFSAGRSEMLLRARDGVVRFCCCMVVMFMSCLGLLESGLPLAEIAVAQKTLNGLSCMSLPAGELVPFRLWSAGWLQPGAHLQMRDAPTLIVCDTELLQLCPWRPAKMTTLQPRRKIIRLSKPY